MKRQDKGIMSRQTNTIQTASRNNADDSNDVRVKMKKRFLFYEITGENNLGNCSVKKCMLWVSWRI